MPKQIRNYPIYLAPRIVGRINENGENEVFDKKTGRSLDPNNLEDKIKIYERQVKGWFLNRASRLLRGKNNGFIILMITISYIEGNEEYRSGVPSNYESRVFFVRGMRRIFSINGNTDQLNDFYSQVRCGLFHSGMTRNKVIITDDDNTQIIDFSENETIKINYRMFLHKIRIDFNRYLKILRNAENVTERNNFDQMFSNLVNM